MVATEWRRRRGELFAPAAIFLPASQPKRSYNAINLVPQEGKKKHMAAKWILHEDPPLFSAVSQPPSVGTRGVMKWAVYVKLVVILIVFVFLQNNDV